jgi:O-antigen ligase
VPEKFEQIQNEQFIYWGTYRGATLLASINAIGEFPLFGAGPTQFIHKVYDHFPFINPDHVKGAHNTLLSIAGESGLIGLLIFILFFINLFSLFWRQYRMYRSPLHQILLACVGMALVWSMVFDAQRDKMFWIVFMLMAATLNLSPQSVQNKGS